MASQPPLDSHSVLRTPSDYGYHAGLSGPDLAIRQAVDSAQMQWTAQLNQLQTYTRLLEARLQQMSDSQSQMMQMFMMSQQQHQQPPRRQGRPHPGKAMRAKKRKQAQALLEQANSSSEEASDADDLAPAAPSPTQAVPPTTSASGAAAAAATAEAAIPGGEPLPPTLPLALAPEGRASADASAPAPPVAQSHQIEEGWLDVAAQVESSAISSGTPQPVAAVASMEASQALVKAAAEEECRKLLEAMKQQQAEEMRSTRDAFGASIAALKSEMLEQFGSVEVLKKQQADDTASLKQALEAGFAALQQQASQFRAEQKRSLEAVLDGQRSEVQNIVTLLTENLASVRTDLQQVQQTCSGIQAASAESFRSIGDEVAAIKLQIAGLMAKTTELTAVSAQDSMGQQQPPSQEAEAAAVATAGADADQHGTQDLPLPPGLSLAPMEGQTPPPMQAVQAEEGAVTAVTAAAGASLSTLPPRCTVLACRWDCAAGIGWCLVTQKKLAEPFVVTATVLSNVKVEAAKALFPRNARNVYTELKDFSGSRGLPKEEKRRSLEDLGCREGSLVKIHFRHGWGGRRWWSYEIIS